MSEQATWLLVWCLAWSVLITLIRLRRERKQQFQSALPNWFPLSGRWLRHLCLLPCWMVVVAFVTWRLRPILDLGRGPAAWPGLLLSLVLLVGMTADLFVRLRWESEVRRWKEAKGKAGKEAR